MTESATGSAPSHPVEVDISGFEMLIAGAQAASGTSDEGTAVRRILEVFVHLALRDSDPASDAVLGIVQRFLAHAGASEAVDAIDRPQALAERDSVDALALARGYGMDRGVYRVPVEFDEPLAEDVLSSFES